MRITSKPIVLAGVLAMSAVSPAAAIDLGASPGSISELAELQDAVVFITASGSFADPSGTYEEYGTGSGFLVSPEGHIVTANHVVAGASTITVDLPGRPTSVNAVILGQSECTDLALLGVDLSGLPYLSWSAEAPVVGLPVYASGYPDGESRFFRTSGTVARDPGPSTTAWSSIEQEIWHDAVIAPGASGGPLVDDAAAVVGVNYAGDDLNRSYAIAGDEASRMITRLRDGTGFSTTSIGLNGEATLGSENGPSGVFVRSVVPGSSAERAGIRAGDLVTSINGRPLAEDGTMGMYCEILASTAPDGVLNLEVVRSDGQNVTGQINGTPLPLADATGRTPTGQSGTSASTKQPDALVLAMMPKSIVKSGDCEATKARDLAKGATASVVCTPPGRAVDTVWYELFGSRTDANAYYESVRREAGARRGSGGDCRTKSGEGPWEADGTKGGRVLCFREDGDIWFVWKDNTLDMVATAGGRGGDYRSLYKWWTNAGPFAPDAGAP